MKTQFAISPDGTRIAYDISGAGPALILLHGAGKDRGDWHKLGYVDRLSQQFKVISLDLRGSGESDYLTHVEDYRIEKLVADVHAVIQACGVEQFAVWGYSLGGNLARYLAAGSPGVQAVAVIGVPLDQAVNEAFDKYISAFVDKYAAEARAYLSGARTKAAIKGRIPVWVACFQAMRQWPATDFQAFRCPAMLLVGAENKTALSWAQAHQHSLARANIAVEIIPGLNHPQEFTCIDLVFPPVDAFLKKIILTA
jgi:pimeloyl-ACP methyl ester carboxylesterase